MDNKSEFRVAMISEHNDPLAPLGGQQAGGQCVYVYELSKALSALGVKVDVFSRWESRKAVQQVRFANRAKVIRLKAGPRQFISKDKFGNLMPEFVERFLEYARERKIKYDIIHSNYYYSGWAGLQLKDILKIPAVITFHSLGLIKKQALGEKDTSPGERIKIEKQIVKDIDKVIATSPQEKEDLIKLYGADKRKIVVVPPGVNLRRFSPLEGCRARKKLGISNDKKIIVFAGKMERRKGGLTLVEAIKEIKKLRPAIYNNLEVLMFSGDPRKGRAQEGRELDERHKLKDAIFKMKVGEKVKLMPGVEQDVLHYYYAAADVVVMPSYYEPFGMVSIEAMATGTPVVASNIGGLKWSIKEGVTGYHAEVKNAKDFAKKLIKILENPKLGDRLGKNGVTHARKNFSWNTIAEDILNIYQKVIKKHNGYEDFVIKK